MYNFIKSDSYGHWLRRTLFPKDFLSKEFLSQFKTQDDVEAFMNELHVQVYEQMLQSEMDFHLGYEKGSKSGINTAN